MGCPAGEGWETGGLRSGQGISRGQKMWPGWRLEEAAGKVQITCLALPFCWESTVGSGSRGHRTSCPSAHPALGHQREQQETQGHQPRSHLPILSLSCAGSTDPIPTPLSPARGRSAACSQDTAVGCHSGSSAGPGLHDRGCTRLSSRRQRGQLGTTQPGDSTDHRRVDSSHPASSHLLCRPRGWGWLWVLGRGGECTFHPPPSLDGGCPGWLPPFPGPGFR